MALDPRMTVFELQRRYPELLPVFARHKIDLCCGGQHPLEVVAAKHGLDLARLLRELEEALKVKS